MGAAVVPIVASIAGAAVTAAMSKTPDMPQVAPAEKPPQAAKAPDVNTVKKANANAAAMGPSAGPSSTWLTGPSGVDSASLNLGKSTLLGA